MRLVKILIAISSIIFLLSCSNNGEIKTNQEVNSIESQSGISIDATSDMSENGTDNYKLFEKYTIDLNGDEINETLKVYHINNSPESLKIKININEIEKTFEVKGNSHLNQIKKAKFINIGHKKMGVIIEMSDAESENYNIGLASQYNKTKNCIIIGYDNNQISTLLDLTSMLFNKDNNYEFKYLGEYRLELYDKATDFNVKYNILFSEDLKEVYDSRLKHFSDLKISESMSKDFYKIEILDANSDGIDEIVCSKVIPGIYHNNILGVISYMFMYEEGTYKVNKEFLKYSDDSNMVIHELRIKS